MTIVREDERGNSGQDVSSVTVVDVPSGTDRLFIVVVHTWDDSDRSLGRVSSISGGGLTYTQIGGVACSGRLSSPSIEAFFAFGSPASMFDVVVTMVESMTMLSAVVVSYSGTQKTFPAPVRFRFQNTNGLNGVCLGGTDNDMPTITTDTPNPPGSVVFNSMHPTNRRCDQYVDDTDYTRILCEENQAGGGISSTISAYERFSAPSPDTITHDITGNKDWTMITFTILPLVQIDIDRGAEYRIAFRDQDITKGGTYRIREEIDVQRAGQYAVKMADLEITKAGQYRLGFIFDVVKGGEYRIIQIQDIQKTGQYALIVLDIEVTKSGEYRMVLEDDITKSGQYAVKPTIDIAKFGQYVVGNLNQDIMRLGQYAVIIVDKEITKSGQYGIIQEQAIIKSGLYAMLNADEEVTKTGEYRVIFSDTDVAKTGQYLLKPLREQLLSGQYAVIVVDLEIVKFGEYRARLTPEVAKLGRYVISGQEVAELRLTLPLDEQQREPGDVETLELTLPLTDF